MFFTVLKSHTVPYNYGTVKRWKFILSEIAINKVSVMPFIDSFNKKCFFFRKPVRCLFSDADYFPVMFLINFQKTYFLKKQYDKKGCSSLGITCLIIF